MTEKVVKTSSISAGMKTMIICPKKNPTIYSWNKFKVDITWFAATAFKSSIESSNRS